MCEQKEFWHPKRYERWKHFHAENPQVYELFVRFAEQARGAGRARFSARCIWERMRWYVAFETTEKGFKLNDHYPPYYSRLLMLTRPEEFEGFFERRDERIDIDDETMRQDFDISDGII